MIFRHTFAAVLAVFLFATAASAQRAEVTITLNEQFFDAFLDAIYRNAAPPEFPLAANKPPVATTAANTLSFGSSFLREAQVCNESIRLLREGNGVRTAVRFRDGKIYAPLAFSGSYNPPLIGCVDFGGWAEANIALEFDKDNQKLIGRITVSNVVMNGTSGIGGGMIARMIQSSIDRKANPIEILRLDKVSFVVPIQNSSSLKMNAVGIRHEVLNGSLAVHIAYEFVKA